MEDFGHNGVNQVTVRSSGFWWFGLHMETFDGFNCCFFFDILKQVFLVYLFTRMQQIRSAAQEMCRGTNNHLLMWVFWVNLTFNNNQNQSYHESLHFLSNTIVDCYFKTRTKKVK